MMVAATRPELCGPIIVAGSPLSYWAGVRGEPDALHRRAARRRLAHRARGRPRRRHLRRGGPGPELREPEPRQHALDQAARPLRQGRHRRPALPRLREVVGRARAAQRRGDAVDRRQPVRRQPARHGRDRDRRRASISQHPLADRLLLLKGDDITPPPQALGWILDLYGSVDDIRANGQTIVYCVHDKVGHLGIFVSGSVAKKEHQEFASNIDLIDCLPPGLYEAVLTPVGEMPGPEGLPVGDYIVSFVARSLDDVRALRRQRRRGRAGVRGGGAAVGSQPRPLPHPPAALGAGDEHGARRGGPLRRLHPRGCSSSCSPTGTR